MNIFWYFIEHPLGQLSWFIAMWIALSWFIQKDDKKTIQIVMFSYIFWIVHFLILEVYSAVATSIIWLIRIFLSLKYKKNKRIFWAIIASILVFWVITYEDKLSILPIIGSCISAYWYFFFEKVRLRMFLVISSLFWFTFNLNIWSVGWTINEVVVQSILIITMYKMIREEWKRVYIVDKVMSIIKKRKAYPDISRFIIIYDYIYILKVWFIKIWKKINFNFLKRKKLS